MSKPAATRRWPDILIGVLVLLLLAGFAALLLGQQKPASTTVTPGTGTPEVQTAPGSDAVGTPAPQDSATTTITPPPADPDTAPVATDGATSDGTATASADTAPADSVTATTATDPATEAPTIPAAPTDPAAAATTPAAGTPDTQTQQTQTPQTQTPQTQTPQTQTPQTQTPQTQITETPVQPPAATTVAPRSGGAVATSASRTPLRSDYRISLGTFSSVGTAQSRTAPVDSLGYTVYPIDVGSQVVAQVGPFADEASARQALGDIQRAYPGALLYRPRERASSQSSSAPAATPAPASRSSSAAPAAPASTTTDAPAAPSGPVYLQVGAFDRVESAQKLVQELRDLGYVPTVNAPEGRKVTVAVGPYTGDALTRTENRLDDNNLDHFRVR